DRPAILGARQHRRGAAKTAAPEAAQIVDAAQLHQLGEGDRRGPESDLVLDGEADIDRAVVIDLERLADAGADAEVARRIEAEPVRVLHAGVEEQARRQLVLAAVDVDGGGLAQELGAAVEAGYQRLVDAGARTAAVDAAGAVDVGDGRIAIVEHAVGEAA